MLIALIHHCKDKDQFTGVADVLVNIFEEEGTKELTNEERLRRMLEVASVACSIRQGSRMSPKHLSTMLSRFPSLPLTPPLHPAILKSSLSVLTAGDMALWAGPGRAVLSCAFEQRPELALPLVLKNSGALLKTMPRKTMEVLAALGRGGRLDRGAVDVEERFGEREFSEENVLLLDSLSSRVTMQLTLAVCCVDEAVDKLYQVELQTQREELPDTRGLLPQSNEAAPNASDAFAVHFSLCPDYVCGEYCPRRRVVD